MRAGLLIGLALAAMSAGARAHAEPAETAQLLPVGDTVSERDATRARSEFEAGERAFASADFTRALADFQRAYALAPHPAVRFNVAVCLERLGRFDEALAEYQAAAADPTLAADGQQRARSEAEALRMRTSSLEITAVAPSARLLVDGRLCPLPCRTQVAPGSHRISAFDGPAERELTTETRAGAVHRLVLDFPADRDRPAPTAPPKTRAAPGRSARSTLPEPEQRASRYPGPLTWIGGSLALSGAVGFGYFGLRTATLHDRYLQNPTAALGDEGRQTRLIANVSLGVLAVGLALAVTDFVLDPPH